MRSWHRIEIRGSITGRNELAIVLGQFAAFVVNAILGATLGHVEGVWRIMFGICALPAIALFFGMLRMPESPRWLVEKGRDDEALAVLKTVRSEDRALAELGSGGAITEEEKKGNQLGFKEILSNKWLRRIVFVGIGVSVTQQLTGINSIMYYGSRVLEESGFSETAARSPTPSSVSRPSSAASSRCATWTGWTAARRSSLACS